MRTPLALPLVALLAVACAGGDAPPADPATVRLLSASEYAALAPLALEPVRPLCGTAPDACRAGALGIVAVRDDGAVAFVLEGRQPQLMLVDDSVAPARPIGRAGGGPGEYRMALGLAFTRDGGLEVLDWLQRRTVRFARDGAPAASGVIPLPRGFITAGYVGDSLRSVATDLTRVREDSAEVTVVAIAGGAAEPVPLLRLARREPAIGVEEMRPAPGIFAPVPRWVLAPDGRVLHTPADQWRVDIFDQAGRHALRAGFDVEPRAVTDAEAARERERRLGRVGNAQMRAAMERTMGAPAARHPAITDLRALHDGRIWVRESPGEVGDSVSWVVLAADGAPVGRAELAVEDLPVGAHAGLVLLSTDSGLRWVRVRR